jgi:hypothetical protein
MVKPGFKPHLQTKVKTLKKQCSITKINVKTPIHLATASHKHEYNLIFRQPNEFYCQTSSFEFAIAN